MRLLTLARDLRRRKARERQGLFVTEGVRAVEELLRAAIAGRVTLRGALVAPELGETSRGAALHAALGGNGLPVLEVSGRDFLSAADTDAPQGVLVLAEVPTHPLETLAAPLAAARPGAEVRLLVLDGVQDPGNAGTILRAAAGLGAAAVAALPGTVDLWSAKVVRSAMGALFHLPTLTVTPDALAAFLGEAGVPLWGAAGEGEPVAGAAAEAPPALAVALGNEGHGLGAAVRAGCTRLVSVPSTPLVESFNVAVAASILLYELRPAALRGPRDG
jgi:TrmH family RNA methyltransferase